MRTVSIAELKATLSEQVRHVRAGEVVLVTDRGRPVARLVPIEVAAPSAENDRLEDLERRGLVRRPIAPLADVWARLPRGQDALATVRQAVDDEREGGW